MVRKKLHEIVGLYDEELLCSSDTEMWDRVIKLGYIPAYTEKIVAIYRRHNRQMHNSNYKKTNMKKIVEYRNSATQKRIDEGVQDSNTRLLTQLEIEFSEIFKNHHGNSLGFARHYLTLYSMVLGLETKQAFEFGIGFSTRTILKALEKTGGKLTSCDVRSPQQCKVIKKGQPKSPAKWKFYQGRSTEILKDLKLSPLDFVLHDGAHDAWTVMNDLEFIIPKMKVNSLLLIHDTDHKYVEITKAVKKALKGIKHERVNLPFGCGLTIIKILEDFGHGSIKTTWSKKKRVK
jgi:predicted O-methyltransferase YrrM